MGEMPLSSESSGSNNNRNPLFSWPEVMLEFSSLTFSGITSQGNNFFLFLNSLIDILPYGTWQPVTHMSFSVFLLDWSQILSQIVVS